MKKLLSVLCLLLLLCSCGNKPVQEEEYDVEAGLASMKIVTPKGAPVLAFYDQIENENYTRVTADAIPALWSTGEQSPDVIVVDISSGLKAIENNAPYLLGAVITFGNFYLAATGNDDNAVMDKGDSVVLFGNENALPGKLFHYIYGTDYDEELIYVADAQMAAAALASGKDLEGNEVDYVFVAEPALTGALKKNEKASVYGDIQKEYKDLSGLDMIQAAVFIKGDVAKECMYAFLERLESSINAAINDPSLIAQGLSVFEGDEATAQYGFNPDLVVNVFNKKNALGNNAMGLGYKKAIDIKKDIDAFVKVLGLTETSEEIYIK